MDPLLLTLRLLHILAGVYWAGTIFFFATFLEPSLRDLGPDGGKVMIRFFERGYLTFLPVTAFIAVASGAWLLWITSGGFDPGWMGSAVGITLSTGGLTAIIAFVVGLGVMRPTAMRIWDLSRQVSQAKDEAARAALMAQMGPLRVRTGVAARIIFGLLLISVALMAVGRYA